MTEEAQRDLTQLRLLAIGGAAALVPLNSTMIAVALPSIGDDFDISVGRTSLLVTVYLVVMLVGQPVGGRVCDRFGATRTLEVALVGFAVASVAASVSPGFELLVLARVGQAVFAATFVPGTQSIVRAVAPPADRGRQLGTLGSMIGVGAAAGPVLGGVLVEVFGWRSTFIVNLPIAAFALVNLLPRPAPTSSAVGPPAETRRTSLARNSVFVAAFGVQALTTLGQYMLLLVAPVLFEARDWSAAAIGLALTGLTIGVIAMGPPGGRAGDRHGRRQPALVGLAVCAVTLVGAAVQGASIEPAALVLVLTAFGFGLGFATPSVQTAALEVVDAHRAGSAAGVLAMSRYVGSIITSLVIAALVTEDGSGAGAAFGVAATAAVAALAVGGFLPRRSNVGSPE